jgi:hypothetical protein
VPVVILGVFCATCPPAGCGIVYPSRTMFQLGAQTVLHFLAFLLPEPEPSLSLSLDLVQTQLMASSVTTP